MRFFATGKFEKLNSQKLTSHCDTGFQPLRASPTKPKTRKLQLRRCTHGLEARVTIRFSIACTIRISCRAFLFNFAGFQRLHFQSLVT